MAATRGVRKINEMTIQEGRALIITEANESNYAWEDIPNGSIRVSGTSGLISVKIAGQSSWIPSNVRIDAAKDQNGNYLDINGDIITDDNYISVLEAVMEKGGQTLSIAKDAIIQRENFTIINPAVGDHQFSYLTEDGTEKRGQIGTAGFYFTLEKGHYQPGRNMLDVIIDDCLFRNAASGGIIELSSTEFILPERIEAGMEIAVKYYQTNKIGNPYPRIYFRKGDYSTQSSDVSTYDALTGLNDLVQPEYAEVGDLWFDYSGNVDDIDDFLGETAPTSNTTLFLAQISDFPRTIQAAQGRGYFSDAARIGHKHTISDITELSSMVEDGMILNAQHAEEATRATNADNATNASYATNSGKLNGQIIGTGTGNIVAVTSTGKIADSLISNNIRTIKNMVDYNDLLSKIREIVSESFSNGMIIAWYGSPIDIPEGWYICDGTNGTPDLTNRFIMGVSEKEQSKYHCGDVINAGLPNISAAFKIRPGSTNTMGTSGGNLISGNPSGALYRTGSQSGSEVTDHDTRFVFDAHKSNPIYGRNDTVQPPAVGMYYIMRKVVS